MKACRKAPGDSWPWRWLVPERKGARRESKREPFLSRVGEEGLRFFRSAGEMVGFIGEAFLAFLKLLRGRARFRSSDLVLFLQECGAEALPIVSLISLLVGMILAFVAAIQLKLFGAQIFVADIVGNADWQSVSAARAGRVVKMPRVFGTMDTPLPESLLGVIWLWSAFYPERAIFDVRAEAVDFYQTYYGTALSSAEADAFLIP
jgi:hypothetical protein